MNTARWSTIDSAILVTAYRLRYRRMNSPEPLDDAVRRRMQKQQRRDTSVELSVRRLLHAGGFRYRVDYRPSSTLRCRGDIVFTRARVVVFIDGCFWHGCPQHATQPKNNAQWWREKLDANMARDIRSAAALEGRGWHVLRFWEHEEPGDIVDRIIATVEN
ncbi:very short patch repair endonuclease [Gordonia sp. Z-3]|uniref:very short patch repair endonuclease n=1 Tax=Gordonia sp. Z-3 TaxID=3115408 RepID=UPI002E2C0675|nr:very short patch repair endonuclease [Gordonia sp. Z-3]MED5801240.1 very short patch repair endonuclease [Gordonia sp. Z-3]